MDAVGFQNKRNLYDLARRFGKEEWRSVEEGLHYASGLVYKADHRSYDPKKQHVIVQTLLAGSS